MAEYKIVLPRRNIRQIASIQTRILAFIIDIIIFFFFILSPFLSLYYYYARLPIDKVTIDNVLADNKLLVLILAGDFAGQAIFFFYLVSFEYLLGATLGKRFLNLSVISSEAGKKPTLLSIVIRNISKSLLITFFVFDVLPVFLDERKRRLSDFLAHTLVVENKKIIKRFPVVDTI